MTITSRFIFVLFALLLIFVTILIANYQAASILTPMQKLMNASNKVAKGDLSVEVTSNSDDEIGRLTHSFNTMIAQLRQRRYVEDLLGRYVGDNIARRILEGEVQLGGQRVHATALFADIRDFTAFSEKADLTILINELNEYYTMMQQVIEAHGGVINKFGGDSILALFGTPIAVEDHAQAAVNAGMSMMSELSTLNNNRIERGDAPLRIGIGVNSGEMIVGNLGSERRREYTVLGDTVNLAKRLSDLNKETPFDTVFIGNQTKNVIDEDKKWEILNLGEVIVKGRIEPVTIHAIMNHSISH